MDESRSLDVLKEAILLEKRGRAFYLKVAEQSQQTAVKAFFELMAEEEEKHAAVLYEQFRSFQDHHQFKATVLENSESDGSPDPVLSDAIKNRISAADFEAAAISAALAMEERAVKLYSSRAESASDPNEKALYRWLTEWERGHMRLLEELDRELREKVWHDNQFWPF